jgi:ATP synthase protein I
MTTEAEDSVEDPDFKPMTAEQARQWREEHAVALSLWRVLFWQAMAGTIVAVAAWLITGRSSVGWSAGYGALAVVIPAALFARGISGKLMRLLPGGAMLGFFVWELVKIAVTVAMLFAAPRLVGSLSWLALLAGFVVTIKVYWVALVVHSRRQHRVK